jgi:hypothetical protein
MEDDLVQLIKMLLDNDEMNVGDMAWALSGVDRAELLGTMNEISDNF